MYFMNIFSQENDRVFAGFMLAGIGQSAIVKFSVCNEAGRCYEAGHFNVLGGYLEMPWT